LDDADLVVNEGLYANHHFHGIPKRSVHEPADCVEGRVGGREERFE
jgi:hypothetical protein